MTYSYRKTAFTKTETVVLEDRVIKLLDENKSLINTVHYGEIKSVTLLRTPTKTARNMHQCTIKTINKTIILRNYSYVSLANFENKNDDYLTFIFELHKKIKNKNIEFKKGFNKNGFFAFIAFLLVMTCLMIVITIALFEKEKYGEAGISTLAVALFIFITITSFTRYKPETYNPDHIPKHILPD